MVKQISDISPYQRRLNIRPIDEKDGYARVSMDIRPYHANVLGGVHGGAIASLADTAAARALMSMFPERQRVATIQMDIHYLTAPRGGQLMAEGRIKKVGDRIAFGDVEIRDDKGETIAIARCTIVIVKDDQNHRE